MAIQGRVRFAFDGVASARQGAIAVRNLRAALGELAAMADPGAAASASIAATASRARTASVETKAAAQAQSAAIKAANAQTIADTKAAAQVQAATAKASAAESAAAAQAQSRVQVAAIGAQSRAAQDAARSEIELNKARARVVEQQVKRDADIARERARAEEARRSAAQKQAAEMAKIHAREAADQRKIDAKARADQAKAQAQHYQKMQRAQVVAAGLASGGSRQEALSSVLQGGGISGGLQGLGVGAGAAAGAAAIAAAAATLAAAVASLTAAGVKLSIEAASFKKNTLIGLETMLGTKSAAEDTFASIKKFADATPFETRDVTDQFKFLLGAGFKKNEVETILKGLYDVSALNNFDSQITSMLTLAISQIRGKGKLMSEELNQLVENSRGIISRTRVYEELGKLMGGKTTDQVIKAIEAGKVTAEQGIKAVLEGIRKNVSGGTLGKLAERLGTESIQGLTSTITSKLFGSFDDVDISPLQRTLKAMVDVLNGPEGDELKSAVEDVMNAVFEGLFGETGDELTGKDKIAAVVRSISAALREAGQIAREAAPTLRMITQVIVGLTGDTSSDAGKDSGVIRFLFGLRDALSVVMPLVNLFGSALKTMVGLITGMSSIGTLMDLLSGKSLAESLPGSGFAAIGQQIVDGIIGGIQSRASAAVESIRSLASSMVTAAKGALSIKSPSRVMRDEVGDQVGAGLIVGVEGRAAEVRAVAQSLAEEARYGASIGLGGGPSVTAGPMGATAGAAPATGTRGGSGALAAAGAPISITVMPGAVVVQGADAQGADLSTLADLVAERLFRRIAEEL